MSTGRIPVGLGAPWWLDTTLYLSADETRARPLKVWHTLDGTCAICGQPPGPPTYRLEAAHVANKMMGGRKVDIGDRVAICYSCHHEDLHGHGDMTLAIRRDTGRPALVFEDGRENVLDVY